MSIVKSNGVQHFRQARTVPSFLAGPNGVQLFAHAPCATRKRPYHGADCVCLHNRAPVNAPSPYSRLTLALYEAVLWRSILTVALQYWLTFCMMNGIFFLPAARPAGSYQLHRKPPFMVGASNSRWVRHSFFLRRIFQIKCLIGTFELKFFPLEISGCIFQARLALPACPERRLAPCRALCAVPFSLPCPARRFRFMRFRAASAFSDIHFRAVWPNASAPKGSAPSAPE